LVEFFCCSALSVTTKDDRCGTDNKPLYSPAATDVLEYLLGELEEDELAEFLPEEDEDIELMEEQRPPASIS